MKTVKVKNVTIGDGIPKICVPMVGKNDDELLNEAKKISTTNCDLVEWRVDYYECVENFTKVKKIAQKINALLTNFPLLFTFRTAQEGGVQEISSDRYYELYHELILTGLIDLMDVELFIDQEVLTKIITEAQKKQIKIIISNHDFEKTPAENELISRLIKMQEKGADICKIAVMPQNAADVLTLLTATNTMYRQHADRPIVTMSMGDLGIISRISGGLFGSAITFAAVGKSSAPGQISIENLRNSLAILKK